MPASDFGIVAVVLNEPFELAAPCPIMVALSPLSACYCADYIFTVPSDVDWGTRMEPFARHSYSIAFSYSEHYDVRSVPLPYNPLALACPTVFSPR